MPLGEEGDKLALIDRLVASAKETETRPDEAFLRHFYRNVAAEDLAERPIAALLDAAVAMWAFLRERRPGKAKIGIATIGGRTVVQTVNDDMPFLVDSLGAALVGLDLAPHLIIHPVLTVTRDAAGRLESLAGEAHESAIQIELPGVVPSDRHAEIVAVLDAVLADVRVSVVDWPAMRHKVKQVAGVLATTPIPAPPAEIAEVAAFLDWLAEDNFTFLGYREYSFGGEGLEVVPGVGKGLLRNDSFLVFEGLRNFAHLSPEVQQFLRSPQLFLISKSNRRSTVHRPAQFDTIIVKSYGEDGKAVGQRLIIGLFTGTSYAQPPGSIPLLRQKVQHCIDQAGFPADSHDGKALQNVLDNFPRDELFQIDAATLSATALGILHLQERQRIALFARRDPFERFVSCLVYVPRDRYSESVLRRMSAILAAEFDGVVTEETTQIADASALARIHFTLDTPRGQRPADLAAIERKLVEAGRTWTDRLGEALVGAHGDVAGRALLRRFADALPAAYTERFSAESAVRDIARIVEIEAGAPIALSLYRDPADGTADLRLKIYHPAGPMALSDALPMLENLGLRAITENPFDCRAGASLVSIQEFLLTPRDGGTIDLAQVGAGFEAAFPLIWSGLLENDGFNRLILRAGLSARQTVILRTYSKLLRQAGSNFSQSYMEDTASAHPSIVRLLVGLFECRFDPAGDDDRMARAARIEARIGAELDAVANLDEDRILRSFLLLIGKTLRSNYYQRDKDGGPKPYLAVKLASREIELLPLPRPLVEIYVYSPRVEGCHLRGGKVARGGIRWSDRKEDFRTEILGLMKAQMVKNAVIVPVGSKGGFVVKRPPEGGREALMAEVVACYRTLMSGLLDLTDTIEGDAVVPPPEIVRHDGDDPYLVVAADKGTATFSDIANGVALEYGFWLGDAFASGGSVGYDHKAMGITARGAWEAVKRHFREIGTDIQTTGFTCVGIGDMSGDVFGNGMLLSPHTQLIAAFDHRQIFIDPHPDAAASWAERKRLFDLPRSSWGDYDRSVLSDGGGIYERTLKSITLPAAASMRFGLPPGPLSPASLIQALLRQPVDLLWFGGIGTYVKASHESQADAGDRGNDALRVDAAMLRAKVVGEGANLAVTQRGRIEYALKGGRINTDAIDNSAGVDTSDHEVNIKIAIGNMIGSGRLAAAERAGFLAEMTDEVGLLVLADNYRQTLALTLAEAEAASSLDRDARLIRALERSGRLDRTIEFLPDDETLDQRAAAKRGLTRPELAVLLAYAKNTLQAELVASDLPDEPEFDADLLAYFPARMQMLARQDLRQHRLRREIIATCLANAVVNRAGPAFAVEMAAKTGRGAADVVRAYRIATEIFELPAIWREIDALDNAIPAEAQTQLHLEVKNIAERATRWLLEAGLKLVIAARIRSFAPGIRRLAGSLPAMLPEGEQHGFDRRKARFLQAGVPEALAERVVALANLVLGLDIVRIDEATEIDVVDMGRLYYGAGERFGLDGLRDIVRAMPAASSWQRLALAAVLDDLYLIQGEIARRALTEGKGAAPTRLDRWTKRRQEAASRVQEIAAEIGRAAQPDLAMLTVATRQLRTFSLS